MGASLEPRGGEEDEMKYIPRELREPAEAPPSMPEEEIAALEELLGYRFGDKKLVEEALTHASFFFPFRPTMSYERLEFVGDGVINCLVARELFVAYPQLGPGPLTQLRAVNVDKEKLSRMAIEHGLHKFLRHKAPQLESQIRDFTEDMAHYPIHSNGLLDPPKALSDIVEAILGAIYVDSKYNQEEVWKVFQKLAHPLISPETLRKHPMSELYELCQKLRRGVKIMKDEWTKNLTVEILVDGELVGRATYAQKKEIAQNRAAKAALERLKEMLVAASETDLVLVEASRPSETDLVLVEASRTSETDLVPVEDSRSLDE